MRCCRHATSSRATSHCSSPQVRRCALSSPSVSSLLPHCRLRQFSSAAAASSPSVNMALVKRLRELSGAPITECKEAITQSVAQSTSSSPSSDSAILSLATDWLRKKGLSTASKKTGRTASEGLVAVAVSPDERRAVVVELNSETDFAARNDRFQSTLHSIAQAALLTTGQAVPTGGAEDNGEQAVVSRVLAAQTEGKTVQELLTDTVTVLRENLQLRRAAMVTVEGDNGAIGVYIHNAVNTTTPSPSSSSSTRLGRTVAVVALSFSPSSSSTPPSTSSSTPLSSLAHKLAMQVTAASPSYLSIASIPPSVLSHERSILASQTSLKPSKPQHTERILEGKMKKFYEEQVMEEQPMLVAYGEEGEGGAGKLKVREVLEREGKKRGGTVRVTGLVKYTVGEGVKKDESKKSFADEVASKLGQ